MKEAVKLCSTSLPAELEWGQVLVSMKYAPIDAADVYSTAMGGLYGSATATPPYVVGHHGIGTIFKVPSSL